MTERWVACRWCDELVNPKYHDCPRTRGPFSVFIGVLLLLAAAVAVVLAVQAA